MADTLASKGQELYHDKSIRIHRKLIFVSVASLEQGIIFYKVNALWVVPTML